MSKPLRKEIREHLSKTLDMASGSIAVRISEIKNNHPQLTPAAAAQILAKRKNRSIMRFLDENDKRSLASIGPLITAPIVRRKAGARNNRRTAAKPILIFSSSDPFIARHIDEINGTYSSNCCTATFILCRKVMENLIVRILSAKFTSVKDRVLYEDSASRRSLDFSVVLDNLYKSRTKFSISTSKVIERIKQKATPFKNDANDKAHSPFHIASKGEIEAANVQEIFDLIMVAMKEVGL
ncbi:MAG TPA: hypothetical protein VN862_00885 [Candidatus Acidoferrales bacterium]|nr:hypothetical protein [Candidatus Acidoferrales bacterium]